MANSQQADTSNCVSNLIHAFADGLDIFKKLRERRRKRRSKREREKNDKDSGAELQLSKSLRRGPREIQQSYDKCYGKAGDRFAKGDAVAHASLAETLIRLNTGLVSIIAAFLNHDTKSHTHLNLDYKSLTSLSDASRREAIGSLDQLCQRLSQSQLVVARIGGCARCGSMKHQNCSSGVPASRGSGQRASSKTRPNGPTVTRIAVKSSKETQLAVVRPRNARKGSNSSSSSTRSHSTAQSSPWASPLGSPLPQYTPDDPFPPAPQKHAGKGNIATGRRRAGSFDGPRPTTWPHTRPDDVMPLQLPPSKAPRPLKSPPPREKFTPSPQSPVKRRMDKATPSTYTFASDSTKLGEIPQRNWAVPFNYAEAERLNAEVAMNGYPTPVAENRPKKKGLFGFLRRGSAAAA